MSPQVTFSALMSVLAMAAFALLYAPADGPDATMGAQAIASAPDRTSVVERAAAPPLRRD